MPKIKDKSAFMREKWKNPVYREQMRLAHTGKVFSKNHKENISKGLLGHPISKKTRLLISKNKKISPEGRKRLSESMKKNNPMANKDSYEKMRQSIIKLQEDIHSVYHTKEYLKSFYKRPTSYEKKISELCIKNKLPFIYTGDGTFFIGSKNPDFTDKQNKIVIEVYSDYFKLKKWNSCEEYEKERTNYFNERGWKVIFIREITIKNKDWEGLCLDKIKNIEND